MATDNLIIEIEQNDIVVVEEPQAEVVQVFEYGTSGTSGTSGTGIPSGGTTGQVLRKKSNANYDVEWYTP